MDRLFIDFSIEKLRQLESRISHCLGLLSTEQIWWRGSEECNSVGNLVLHLSGNVRQWIISSIGGASDLRQRDSEFAARGNIDGAELRVQLTQTMDEAIRVIEGITLNRLSDTIRVQGYNKTVLEAVYHVVEHFSLHTGQIMYVTKLLRKEDLGFYRHLGAPAHREKTP
jgi:uncharacterized damage-inducible protein DinB